MRSLRVRAFLISWPLVVSAVAVVAFGIDRYALVEMERVSLTQGPVPIELDATADSLVSAWPALARDTGSEALRRLFRPSDSTPALVVLDREGELLATTDSTVTSANLVRSGPGIFTLTRAELSPRGDRLETALSLSGIALVSLAGDTLGTLLVLPTPAGSDHTVVRPSAWYRGARRTLWITALATSLAAAIAALLLFNPLVRRVRRLADAATAIQSGRLDVRVTTPGDDELGRLGRSFNDMAAALERAQAQQRNLVSDVAHELRTPLTNLIGLLEAIDDGLRTPNPATLATLRSEAGLLASLVNDLQELTLAESGQLPVDLQPVAVAALAWAAIDAMAPRANGITLIGPTTEASPHVARADPRRLGQILGNLLQNAITHTPAGGRITVTIEAVRGRIILAIADTGRGIPAAHLPFVWDRFHRVDSSRDRNSGGMGLGLALVRQFAAAMGGTVGVESRLGQGSRFWVDLPTSGGNIS